MDSAQPAILDENTSLGRYISFSIHSTADLESTLKRLVAELDVDNTVLGIGESLVKAMGRSVPGLSPMPSQCGSGVEIPSIPAALWCSLKGDDRGELFHRSLKLEKLLSAAFEVHDVIDCFQYDHNRDLSGYEDGTENPEGEEAVDAAILKSDVDGLSGSSFVAVQQWLHDFEALDAMTTAQRDDVIGRHISNNEEFDDAPQSAHVKRAAQESFDPEAFMLRRSMPWAEGPDAGLVFVAFGKSFDAFEAVLNRMLGNEDGIRDGLFTFTRPLSGAYYWCPPVKSGRLDLSLLGL